MYKFTMKTRSDGQDEASCNGLVAISRNGASCKLARMMVAEGMEDGPVVLMSGDTVSMEFTSLYWLAGKTYSEGNARPRMIDFVTFSGV